MEVDNATAVVNAFATYAGDRDIMISEAIKLHRFPGRGLGIAATRKIQVCRLCLLSCGKGFIAPCLLIDLNFLYYIVGGL